jgi:hypothetical protein
MTPEPLDPAIKALLIRTRDLLIPACITGMPGAGLDYQAAADLLEDVLTILQKDEKGTPP